MSIRGQLAILSGVFVIGGLGGAGALKLASSNETFEKSRASEKADDAEPPLELAELRDALDALGVPTSEDGGAEATTSHDDVGVPLGDVLEALESQYQAGLREADRARSDEYAPAESSPQAALARDTAHSSNDQPTIIGARRERSEPAAPERVAALRVDDAGQVNVNPGTVNVTNVTETTTNNTNTLITAAPGYPLAYVPSAGYVSSYPAGAVYGGVYAGAVHPPPPRVAHPSPARATAPGKRYDSLHPPAGADSPMFPAHASASLGPIFGGMP